MFVRGSIETPSLLCSSFLGAGASNVWGEWGVLSPPTILGSAVWCWVQPPIHHNFAPELDRPAGQYERIPQVWHTAAGGYSTSHHGQHPWSPSLSSSLSLYLSLGRVRVPKWMNFRKFQTAFAPPPHFRRTSRMCFPARALRALGCYSRQTGHRQNLGSYSKKQSLGSKSEFSCPKFFSLLDSIRVKPYPSHDHILATTGKRCANKKVPFSQMKFLNLIYNHSDLHLYYSSSFEKFA